MATIVILEHLMQRGVGLPYMVYKFAELWRLRGHSVIVHHGPDNPPRGDVAILNVDLTVIPAEYRSLLRHYPRVVNASVLDVSKRQFSQDILGRDSEYDGPVIIKTDANYGGRAEQLLRSRALEAGAPCDITAGPVMTKYPILASPREVPEDIWRTPGLVVEKFLPERDERGYYLRTWIFFGDRERSSRWRAAVPIIKSRDYIERETVPVPDEIRAWRTKLGFDFGKFDYVHCDDRHVLLDVNRTPGYPPPPPGRRAAPVDFIAEGLESFLR
jgi:hypothetical protein